MSIYESEEWIQTQTSRINFSLAVSFHLVHKEYSHLSNNEMGVKNMFFFLLLFENIQSLQFLVIFVGLLKSHLHIPQSCSVVLYVSFLDRLIVNSGFAWTIVRELHHC